MITISETKNLTAAAKVLHISQPALSKTVKKLEQELGTELLVRERRAVLLTPAGELLVEEGRKILNIRDNIYQELNRMLSCQSERLRIGMTPLYAQSFFPMVFTEFRRKYPNTAIDLYELQGEVQEDFLLRNEIDLGILASPSYRAQINYEPIYHERWVLIMDQESPYNRFGYTDKASGLPFIDLINVSDADFLGFSKNRANLAKQFDAICAEAGFTPNIIFTSNLSVVLRSMVSSGLGISIVSWMTLFMTSLADGLYPVKYYNFSGDQGKRTYWCAYNKASRSAKGIQDFIKICLKVHKNFAANYKDLQYYNQLLP